MCGRYALHNTDLLPGLFEVSDTRIGPRFNIAPTQQVPIVRLDPSGQRQLAFVRWGLVPAWAKDPTIGSRMINARSETVAEKPSFRSAFRHRRCLIPADGFFEWRKTEPGKQPFFIHMTDGKPFAFAGIWEQWKDSGSGEPLESCSILTCPANELVGLIHDRMPVILSRDRYESWLEPTFELGKLSGLLETFPSETMVSYPVSRLVNSPANNNAGCIEPIEPEAFSG